MKRIFSIISLLLAVTGIVACENEQSANNNNNEEPKVTLTADKETIAADGVEVVTFEALVDGKANEEVSIICLNDNSTLSGNTFTTTKADDYRFKALYGKYTSPEVSVKATPAEVVTYELTLASDKKTIVADGTAVVTFTVTLNEEDVTTESSIFNTADGEPLASNTFTTSTAGTFTFKAIREGKESNEVTITAIENQETPATLELKASKLRIKADGTDSVTFTVMLGEEDVTEECEFSNITDKNNIVKIEGNTFTSTTVGTFKFKATHADRETNTITIDVYDPNWEGKYEPGMYYNENGIEGVIFAIKADNNGDTWCYLVSMDEEDLQWSTENVCCNCFSDKGIWNTKDPFDPVYSRADGGVRDINNYPAFKWCMEHGDGWFLPSYTELNWMWEAITNGERDFNVPSVAAFNKVLTDHDGTAISQDYYWSSNEETADMATLVAFMDDSIVCLDPQKTKNYRVRATYRFKLN